MLDFGRVRSSGQGSHHTRIVMGTIVAPSSHPSMMSLDFRGNGNSNSK